MIEMFAANPSQGSLMERSRTYYFGNEHKVRLDNVCEFKDSNTTHRLKTQDGRHWIIPKTFIAIELDIDDWSF